MAWWRRRAATRRYLKAFIDQHKYFEFTGIETLALKPIELIDGYVALDLVPFRQPTDVKSLKAGEAQTILADAPLDAQERNQPVELSQITTQAKKIAIIGDAGSGKSALLQWAGLALAEYQTGRKLTNEQRPLVKALGAKRFLAPVVPVIA